MVSQISFSYLKFLLQNKKKKVTYWLDLSTTYTETILIKGGLVKIDSKISK